MIAEHEAALAHASDADASFALVFGGVIDIDSIDEHNVDEVLAHLRRTHPDQTDVIDAWIEAWQRVVATEVLLEVVTEGAVEARVTLDGDVQLRKVGR